jgi:predicted ATPase
MLTRIEISGFKTFSEFKLDFLPFTAIVGLNATGKSNLFDVLQLLARLARYGSIAEAFKGLRGQPHEFFRREGDGRNATEIDIAAEVLIDGSIQDPYGANVEIANTRLRYELTIGQRRNEAGVDRLQLIKEKVLPIAESSDKLWLKTKKAASPFNNKFMKRTTRRAAYLDTRDGDEKTASFVIGQDGHGGRKREIPNVGVESTILASITNAQEFPTLYALREELRSWRFLQVDPSDLRRPSSTMANDELEPSGSNLPTVLARVCAETRTDSQPRGALIDITEDLVHLIPGVRSIDVIEDKRNQEYYIQISMRGGAPYSARVVSDGTLRVLALLTILHDPRRIGLIALEEPENGVHPRRLIELVRTLRSLVTPINEQEYDTDLPLRQMIVSSHSPYMTENLVEEGEIVLLDTVTTIDPGRGTSAPKTYASKVIAQGELWWGKGRPTVGAYEVEQLLVRGDPKAATVSKIAS